MQACYATSMLCVTRKKWDTMLKHVINHPKNVSWSASGSSWFAGVRGQTGRPANPVRAEISINGCFHL